MNFVVLGIVLGTGIEFELGRGVELDVGIGSTGSDKNISIPCGVGGLEALLIGFDGNGLTRPRAPTGDL